jgi:uncharacterized membrane protein (DUF485 family)
MRLGMLLFCLYSLLYVGFVMISAFAPQRMEVIVWAGLNLAVLYGFALIIVAFVMAMIYGLLCHDDDAAGERP